MTFISIIIASAGLSLGMIGPDGAQACQDDCAKTCCVAAEADAKPCCADDSSNAELPMVETAAYAAASWPAHNTGESLYAKNFQGKALPVALGTETWISKKVDTAGKVVILDFWATWCPPCRSAMPILDQLQKDNHENLAVLAIGGQREDEDTVRSFVKEHKESISNLFDADQSVYKKFESKGIPLVVVMSTDGVIRWIGNPHDENFKKAVSQVISVDPMIAAKG